MSAKNDRGTKEPQGDRHPNEPREQRQQQAQPAASALPASRFAELYDLTAEQVEVVRRVMCPTATDDELHYFFGVVKRTKLDAFTNQIWPVKRKQRVTDSWGNSQYVEVARPQTGIDGYRVLAERTGEYEGQDDVEWCGIGKDGKPFWTDVWLDEDPPRAARATVHRKGRKPMRAVALWDEYVPTYRKQHEDVPMPKWQQSPASQLAKCAEALAFRKAFPHDLSGLYTDTELERTYAEAEAANTYAAPSAVPANAKDANPRPPAPTPVQSPPAQLVDAETAKKADEMLIAFEKACADAKSMQQLRDAQKLMQPYFAMAEKKDPHGADVVKRGEPVYMRELARVRQAERDAKKSQEGGAS